MNTVKKVLTVLVNVVSVAVIVIAIFMLLTALMTKSGSVPSFMGHSVFRVMTGSMEPNLRTNSLIIVRHTDTDQIKAGDIITFYSSDPMLKGSVNTHRVMRTEVVDGETVFYTKGDANQIEDKYFTRGKDIIGKVVFSSVVLGTVVRLASNPIVFIPVIIIPLVLMLVLNIVKSVRITKTMMAEEEAKAIAEAREAARKREEERKARENAEAESAPAPAPEEKTEGKQA